MEAERPLTKEDCELLAAQESEHAIRQVVEAVREFVLPFEQRVAELESKLSALEARPSPLTDARIYKIVDDILSGKADCDAAYEYKRDLGRIWDAVHALEARSGTQARSDGVERCPKCDVESWRGIVHKDWCDTLAPAPAEPAPPQFPVDPVKCSQCGAMFCPINGPWKHDPLRNVLIHDCVEPAPAPAPTLDLDVLDRLEKRATPGEWSVVRDRDSHWGMVEVAGPALSITGFTIATDVDLARAKRVEADADLIAALRNAYPLIRAEFRSRDAELAKLRDDVERMRKVGGEMANICFNIGQCDKPTLSGRELEILCALRNEWDAALRTGAAGVTQQEQEA